MHDAPWLKEAWRELGEAEHAGMRENPRIVAMFREVGHVDIRRDEVAWCAAFCGACLERAGIGSTRSLLARSYLKWGASLIAPRIGAIAVLTRGSDPGQGHVGFWLGETDEDVVLLGGNQADAVSVARFPKSRLLALRWPGAGVADGAAALVFDRALDHVLEMEGGYTDDPHDPGGPTNRGITLAVFAAWRKLALTDANRASLIRDLKAIDHPTVREIYRRRYWSMAHCGGLPAPLALMHFDAAVNHGVGNAVRFLQEAVGASVDGEIGPETQAVVARTPAGTALDAYAAIRKRRYRALPHFWRFGRGWLRRVDITLARARALAPETVSTSPKPEGDTDMTTTTGPLDGKWWGHSITIWGTIVTLLSTMLPVLAPVTGIDVDSGLVQDAGTQVVEVMQAVGALIGTLMTIYGRVRATEPIQKALLKKD
jgi:uncharacterized protein (TIGR02594 family)